MGIVQPPLKMLSERQSERDLQMKPSTVALILVFTFLLGSSSVAAAPEEQTSGVYGWVGTIYTYSRPNYDDYFVRNDGELYGITGETASVELLLQQRRGTDVKIWGLLLKPAPDFLRNPSAIALCSS